MTSLQPKDLAPSARAALRRVLLSRSKGPDDGDKLTPERLRLIEAIGESAYAADLRKRYPAAGWGKSSERKVDELDLLLGNTETACAAANGKPTTEADWLPLPPAFAAPEKDAGANLISEQNARTNESLGLWLVVAFPAINTS